MTGGRFWVVVIVVALSTACGGADSGSDRAVPVTTDPEASTTTAAPEPTTTTVFAFGHDQELVSKVWADYLAATQAVDDASFVSDPHHPDLVAHLTGPHLETWQAVLAERRVSGQYAFFPTNTQHRRKLFGVSIVDDSTIELTACAFDDAIVAVRATGEVIDDEELLVRSVETMKREGDQWKLWGRDISNVAPEQCPEL